MLHLQPSGAYTTLDTLLRLRFVVSDLSLFARRASADVMNGSIRTRFRGRGMEFEEVRLYQAGDDIRSIDWRVTARTQTTHTKLFREERERPVFLMVDQRSPMFFGSKQCFKSVYAAHLASLLGWTALSNSDRIGAQVFGDLSHRDIRPRRSKHALMELLHQLNDFNHQLKRPIAASGANQCIDMLADVRRIAKPGSAVFLLSDFHDFNPACEEQLFQLRRHTDVTLFHIYDDLERRLPSANMLTITDGNKRLTINTTERGFSNKFTQHFESQRQALEKTCVNLAIPLVSANIKQDPIQLLAGIYGRKRRR